MKISFGNTRPTEYGKQMEAVTIDLGAENIHFIFLLGEVGGGKSFFHRHAYKELIDGRIPRKIQLLFLDVSEIDSKSWNHSPYLFAPVATEPKKAFQ
ncbi:MAG: hypothetical protein ABI747_00550 [Candidatus Moraniibacteriota bacterium]